MCLSRVRFTVRRMMVMVAVIGVLSGGLLWLKRRHERFSRLSSWHGNYVRWIGVGCLHEMHWSTYGGGPLPADWSEAREDWHRALMEKYQAAASRPWFPVEADPAPP